MAKLGLTTLRLHAFYNHELSAISSILVDSRGIPKYPCRSIKARKRMIQLLSYNQVCRYSKVLQLQGEPMQLQISNAAHGDFQEGSGKHGWGGGWSGWWGEVENVTLDISTLQLALKEPKVHEYIRSSFGCGRFYHFAATAKSRADSKVFWKGRPKGDCPIFDRPRDTEVLRFCGMSVSQDAWWMNDRLCTNHTVFWKVM